MCTTHCVGSDQRKDRKSDRYQRFPNTLSTLTTLSTLKARGPIHFDFFLKSNYFFRYIGLFLKIIIALATLFDTLFRPATVALQAGFFGCLVAAFCSRRKPFLNCCFPRKYNLDQAAASKTLTVWKVHGRKFIFSESSGDLL